MDREYSSFMHNHLQMVQHALPKKKKKKDSLLCGNNHIGKQTASFKDKSENQLK